MATTKINYYSNIPSYPAGWYEASGYWAASSVAFNGTYTTWAATHIYAKGDIVVPTVANSYGYVAITGGLSSNIEPTWVAAAEASVTDNVVSWRAFRWTKPRIQSPVAFGVDVSNQSYRQSSQLTLDPSLDASWDWGQNIGTWTAGRSYASGDWVRPATPTYIPGGTTGYGYVANNPIMAGNNSPNLYTVTATSGSNPYLIFDGVTDISHSWYSSVAVSSAPQGFMLDLGSGRNDCFNRFSFSRLKGSSPWYLPPKRFVIQATNAVAATVSDAVNNGNWNTLVDYSSSDFPYWNNTEWVMGWIAYGFTNNVSYQKYRVIITAIHEAYSSDGTVAIGEWYFCRGCPLIYKLTTPGISSSTEPTWNTTVGGTTNDGTAVWTTYLDDSIGVNRAGVDYYVYCCQTTSQTAPKILLSRNSTYPHGYTASNSRKIGGWHGLCASVGTISSHPLSDHLTGDVLLTSVWDLNHRSTTLVNSGMAYVDLLDEWYDIYLQSSTSTTTASALNATFTTSRMWNDHVDDGGAVKKRLLDDSRFQVVTEGSNQQTNLLGGNNPVTTGGHVDTTGRRMISNYGLEDCVGVMWQWLSDQSYQAGSGGAGWKNVVGSKGQLYLMADDADVKVWAGGAYDSSASNVGSRSRVFSRPRWYVYSAASARFYSRSITK